MNGPRLRLGLLMSGGGRTALNLHEQIASGRLNAVIEVVISSRAEAHGVSRLSECGLTVDVIERGRTADHEFHQAIADRLARVDLVCMCGFLSLWVIPPEFEGRVINIHPALLPDFGGRGMYGRRVHEAVLKSGATVSGCTVHFCDNQYDHGPIILQRRVPVMADDTPETLGARVFEAECVAYPEAIRWYIARWAEQRPVVPAT